MVITPKNQSTDTHKLKKVEREREWNEMRKESVQLYTINDVPTSFHMFSLFNLFFAFFLFLPFSFFFFTFFFILLDIYLRMWEKMPNAKPPKGKFPNFNFLFLFFSLPSFLFFSKS